MNLSDFIFHACYYPEEPDLLTISINTKKCWEKEHCLVDMYTDEEEEILEPIISKYDLERECDSTYVCYGYTVEEITRLLKEEGLEINEEFNRFIGPS